MSLMESGVNTPKPVEQKENDPKSDILNNIADYYHSAVEDFLADPHEFGVRLQIRGEEKAKTVRDAFKGFKGVQVTMAEEGKGVYIISAQAIESEN